MMRSVQRELTSRLGDVCCYAVLPREQALLAYSVGIVPVTFGNDRIAKLLGTGLAGKATVYNRLLKTCDMRRFFKSFFRYEDVWNFVYPREADNSMGGFDAVVDVHGFAFGDEWDARAPRMAREWTKFCHDMGKRFIFMPQAWGSFQKKGFAEPISAMLRESSLYYARDKVSQSHLAKILDKPVDEVPVAPDIVLRFQGAFSPVGAYLLRTVGVDASRRPIIGISPNMKVFERTKGKGTGNAYVMTLAHICDYCVDRFAAKVVLLPNELSPPSENRRDDRYLCALIHSSVKNPSSCAVLRGYHSAEEIKSVISNCDILIGSRFHALVFALSEGVPVLALSWSHKYRELLCQFGLEEFVFDHDEMDESEILELLNRLWEEREGRAKTIGLALPELWRRVDILFDQAAKVIQGF